MQELGVGDYGLAAAMQQLGSGSCSAAALCHYMAAADAPAAVWQMLQCSSGRVIEALCMGRSHSLPTNGMLRGSIKQDLQQGSGSSRGVHDSGVSSTSIAAAAAAATAAAACSSGSILIIPYVLVCFGVPKHHMTAVRLIPVLTPWHGVCRLFPCPC